MERSSSVGIARARRCRGGYCEIYIRCHITSVIMCCADRRLYLSVVKVIASLCKLILHCILSTVHW